VKIAIVDYRAGNLASVRQAFVRLGTTAVIADDPEQLSAVDRIVVPGVGHFSNTASLTDSGLRAGILEAVEKGVPLLGICLGMQWLFQASQEAPGVRGLGIMDGTCEHLPAEVKSPHVGWNQLEIQSGSRLFRNVQSGSYVYFTHSFCAPITPETSAVTEYGRSFAAAVERRNVLGVQFHPEKSGKAGMQILANFCADPC
jgi:imidazole glycerol-phosphate synthase subunit HisH